MKFSSFLLFSTCILLLHSGLAAVGALHVVSTITVDNSGRHGNFRTVQGAINSVPDWNTQWIRIHVHQGVYREQVTIPREKQFIFLEGQGTETTVIQWNAHTQPGDNEIGTAAFVVSADHFVARHITFQRIEEWRSNFSKLKFEKCIEQLSEYFFVTEWKIRRLWNQRCLCTNQQPNSFDYKQYQAVAVAAVIDGDKCSFYDCKFLSYQDTLCDYRGRHYFSQCWIEGGVDFIFGQAASIYEGCTLNSILLDEGPSWFTAHAKVDLSAPGGFVFKNCILTGSGNMYLGRAWNEYSTVIFYKSYMSGLVVPLGWDSWQHDVSQITYAEDGCTGQGSGKGQRVPWEKQLSAHDWNRYLGHYFIDQERWIERQAP